jgi:hypothetical protein
MKELFATVCPDNDFLHRHVDLSLLDIHSFFINFTRFPRHRTSLCQHNTGKAESASLMAIRFQTVRPLREGSPTLKEMKEHEKAHEPMMSAPDMK